jgi:hypothetical protein
MPLTDLAVRAALPGGKTIRLFDSGGLYLEVAPSGGKWWRLKYRYAGVEKRISLGTIPLTSLKAARLARDRAKAGVGRRRRPQRTTTRQEGGDPDCTAAEARRRRDSMAGASLFRVEARNARSDRRIVAQRCVPQNRLTTHRRSTAARDPRSRSSDRGQRRW